MPVSRKPERIRDPLHNLIEFDQNDQLERSAWAVIQSRPFQRLRRIRQLGFSEFVFPGATHTRFAHSIGTFYIARQLKKIISNHTEQFHENQWNVALAASLVHDIGHGMFSHTFEKVGKIFDLPMAKHEEVSEKLIREREIAEIFSKEFGSGFANDVANLVKRKVPQDLFNSVVSSQFDADRLDYMQRDRIMTGVQSSGIDAIWLLNNLEIGTVSISADDQKTGTVDTLVLNPKAFYAAENYVLSLFQLYPNIYMHKTTRCAELLFSRLMAQIVNLVRRRHAGKIGLPKNHPIRRFAEDPTNLDWALALDDSVFWGALPLMMEASDPFVGDCASRLHRRKLPKCIDIRRHVENENPPLQGIDIEGRSEREAQISLRCKEITKGIKEDAARRRSGQPPILVDEDRRTPYQKFQDSKTPLNQILIHYGENRFEDMAHLSAAVASAEAFEICRASCVEGDTEGRTMIENKLRT